MKRLFYSLFIFLSGVSAFTLLSCDDNEEEEPVIEGSVKINDVQYDISNEQSWLIGRWDDNFGFFYIQVAPKSEDSDVGTEYYIFKFATTETTPKKGVNLANAFLRVEAHAQSNLLSEGAAGSIYGGPLKYISGSIVVENIDIPNNKMTVKIRNLRVEATTVVTLDDTRKEYFRSYTFDGTVTVDMWLNYNK